MRQIKGSLKGARLLAANILRAWRWHLLGFRLVTFGLYEPHPWYGQQGSRHRWWQVNPRVAWLLFRHAPAYGRWLVEMEAAMRREASGWWEQRAGRAGHERLRAWMAAANAPEAALPGQENIIR